MRHNISMATAIAALSSESGNVYAIQRRTARRLNQNDESAAPSWIDIDDAN